MGAAEFLKKMLNPFPSEGFEDKNISGDQSELNKYKNKQLVRQAGRNLLGWGGTFFALRMLLGERDKLRNKQGDKKIRSYLNARYPIVSFDPSLKDNKIEALQREIGVDKTANVVSEGFGQVQDFVGMMGRKDRANLHLAATLAASYGGGVLGWKIADKLLDKQRERELDKKIEDNRNEMDKLMYTEYLRTRGLPKTAKDENKHTKPASSLWRALGAAWWVWAVGSMAIAYRAGKGYMDSTDPNRKRVKELQEIAKSQAKLNENPILIGDSDFNPVSTLGALKPKKSVIRGAVDLPKKIVDSRDPYAAALGGVKYA